MVYDIVDGRNPANLLMEEMESIFGIIKGSITPHD